MIHFLSAWSIISLLINFKVTAQRQFLWIRNLTVCKLNGAGKLIRNLTLHQKLVALKKNLPRFWLYASYILIWRDRYVCRYDTSTIAFCVDNYSGNMVSNIYNMINLFIDVMMIVDIYLCLLYLHTLIGSKSSTENKRAEISCSFSWC